MLIKIYLSVKLFSFKCTYHSHTHTRAHTHTGRFVNANIFALTRKQVLLITVRHALCFKRFASDLAVRWRREQRKLNGDSKYVKSSVHSPLKFQHVTAVCHCVNANTPARYTYTFKHILAHTTEGL